MVKAFHSTFTASHDLTDLRIRHVFHKFQDEEILSLWRQPSDQFEKCGLLLGTNQVSLRVISLGCKDRHVIDRDLLPAASVTMPVCNQVMSDAIQPGRKRDATISVIFDVIHCPLKHTGSQILCIMEVSCSIIHIVEDAIEITLIE